MDSGRQRALRGGTYAVRGCSLLMNKLKSENAEQKRERKIDEALKETFPASDTPSFVGAGSGRRDGQGIVKDERGQEQPSDKKRAVGKK
jgi:hypothetical protein